MVFDDVDGSATDIMGWIVLVHLRRSNVHGRGSSLRSKIMQLHSGFPARRPQLKSAHSFQAKAFFGRYWTLNVVNSQLGPGLKDERDGMCLKLLQRSGGGGVKWAQAAGRRMTPSGIQVDLWLLAERSCHHEHPP